MVDVSYFISTLQLRFPISIVQTRLSKVDVVEQNMFVFYVSLKLLNSRICGFALILICFDSLQAFSVLSEQLIKYPKF